MGTPSRFNETAELKLKILNFLRSSTEKIHNVPTLANRLEESVTPTFLTAIFQLKEQHLITWRLGKFIYLAPKGYEYLDERNIQAS